MTTDIFWPFCGEENYGVMPKKVYDFILSTPARFSIVTEQTYTQNLKSY